MPDSQPSWLPHYLQHHRLCEALIATGVLTIGAIANVGLSRTFRAALREKSAA